VRPYWWAWAGCEVAKKTEPRKALVAAPGCRWPSCAPSNVSCSAMASPAVEAPRSLLACCCCHTKSISESIKAPRERGGLCTDDKVRTCPHSNPPPLRSLIANRPCSFCQGPELLHLQRRLGGHGRRGSRERGRPRTTASTEPPPSTFNTPPLPRRAAQAPRGLIIPPRIRSEPLDVVFWYFQSVCAASVGLLPWPGVITAAWLHKRARWSCCVAA
jgi:hypothetical protein